MGVAVVGRGGKLSGYFRRVSGWNGDGSGQDENGWKPFGPTGISKDEFQSGLGVLRKIDSCGWSLLLSLYVLALAVSNDLDVLECLSMNSKNVIPGHCVVLDDIHVSLPRSF